jgi:hypothetical protein
MKGNCAWKGSGSIPLDYAFVLKEDEGKEAGTLRSVLNIVGTVVRMEHTPYKSNIYVSGMDPHLVDPTVWAQQMSGLTQMEASLPLEGDFVFQKSGQAIVCGVKNDAKHPVVVVDHENKELEGSVKELIKEGSLVVVHFIPYPWEANNKQGISFTARKIKIVHTKHLGPTALAGAKRECPSLDGSPSPKRVQTSFIFADDLPSTEGLSFITGE